MALSFIYITNKPKVAHIAEKYGVDHIMVDLEQLGKEERQKNMNTVKSQHTISDVKTIKEALTTSKTLVRINPWNIHSQNEIESVISAGADVIMLPMWKNYEDVDSFLQAVNRRVKTILLLETKEAVACIDSVLKHSLIDEIHIGLNDLHLSYGLSFMFELLSNGVVETLSKKFIEHGIQFGFGGIAKIGEGCLPAEYIIKEHYRLGSSRAILSRSFCNSTQIKNLHEIDETFRKNILSIRKFEESLLSTSEKEFLDNKSIIDHCVLNIVKSMKESSNEF